MDSTHVYASHLIGDSATSPSPSSLILSEDNQFALVTKSTIFIYTPSTTIQFDQVKLKQAEAKALFAKGKGKSLNHQNELSMFTTTLAAEKKDIINWQTFSNGQSRDPLFLSSYPTSLTRITIVYLFLCRNGRLQSCGGWST
jgi:hypothetical protein